MNHDTDNDVPLAVRGFGRTGAGQAAYWFGLLVVLCVCYWFLLPIIQSHLIPSAPGGRNGPWIVRPILAFRFGAVAILASVSGPLLLRPLTRAWQRDNAALGTRYDPFADQPFQRIRMLFGGFVLLAVYASALVFYLFSWKFIGPVGIEEHLPWETRTHAYREIAALQMLPEGQRSDSLRKNGPWYEIRFHNGRHMNFGEDNEGATRDSLAAIAAFIAEQSGLKWQARPDARPR